MKTDDMSRRSLLRAGVSLAGAATWDFGSSFAAARLEVVASFSILADLVSNVGGERIRLGMLVGPNGDAHAYAPTPADAKRLAAAGLVVVNGMGLEGWMPRLIQASGTKAPIVVAAEGIKPRRDTHDRASAIDPHAWQSVENAKIYVENIRDSLSTADPAGSGWYTANAARYVDQLDALDREIRAELAAIPTGRRKIITTHDAFGYFQDAYGIEFLAPQGVSTEAEPSAKDVAAIIAQVRRQKIPAVFLENISDPRLLERIVAESGAKIGGTLYSDALTPPGGEAPTYIAMMRHNAAVLAAALTS
jgi:zinc/manganese transport system substrate-binding protein